MSIQALHSYMQENQLSQNQVAAQLGKSASTINQYLHGKYKGDVTALDKAVNELIARQNEKAKDIQTPFVKTKTAARILEICGLAHAMADIYLVIGEAGLGKTMALKHYANTNSNVIMLEVDPTFSAKVMLSELCNLLGISIAGNRNNHAMMTAITDKLKGSQRLLIVDEAELLSYKPLEILRRIHDKAGIGMVLAGMPRLTDNLRGSRGEYKQLYSRVGLALDLKNRLPDDDVALLVENGLGTDAFNKRLNDVSHGNARRLNKLLRGINRMAVINQADIDETMIERFAEMLID